MMHLKYAFQDEFTYFSSIYYLRYVTLSTLANNTLFYTKFYINDINIKKIEFNDKYSDIK